ncbi:unnamed protein product [Leptidea sinapis]|uniref:EGF-like domain-containing protein n=1 Tax=Leptidea sinapis TaxID=189913 RepID=A0A5E4R1T0_9NEOP|nr:unnamed protein product [Leptidea sinapis]
MIAYASQAGVNGYMMMYLTKWKRVAVLLLFIWIVVTYLVISPLRCEGTSEEVVEFQERLKTVSMQLESLQQQHSKLISQVKKSQGRRIYSNSKEIWYFINHELTKLMKGDPNSEKIQAILDQVAHRKRSLLSDQQKLQEMDGYLEWRRSEAANVSELGCGFGCQLHHIVYCLIFAYARTYDPKVVSLPFIDSISKKPKFLPLAVPSDLAHRVHIRRTDKVGTEAAFHSIDEYMTHVRDYYDQLALTQPVEVRRVYLASDDSNVRYCKRPGECRCKLGFYGERCNKCIPLPGCQHGYCNVSFECICKEGWDGIFCSEPMCRSDCHSTRGFCETPGECRCRLGWAGATCRDCQPLPGCQHGYCDKPLECKCSPGYTGLLCQTPICATGCHGERGYCRRPGECRCKVGWTGLNCAQCHRYPGCVHGTCNRPWECICKPGWGGMLCDEELNYCENNPDTCKNDGKCQSLESGDGLFRCQCPSGIKGKYCEILPESMTTPVSNVTQSTTENSIVVEVTTGVTDENETE